MYPPSKCGTDPGSVAGGWWLAVAGTGFTIKPMVFQFVSASLLVKPTVFQHVERKQSKTNGFSTCLSEHTIKPMLFQNC